jgi:hypothetical protein
LIKGVGKDTETTTNENGGMQSLSPYRFDLIPPEAMFRVAEVFAYGATKYAPDNWRKIKSDDHLNHLFQHLYAYMAGDRQDDHLGHALCRMMMFVTMEADK